MLRVTDALKEAGLIDVSGPWFTDEARDRGKAVHRAIELDLAGELDEDTVHEAVRPYLESWRAFYRSTTGLVIVRTEFEVEHGTMGYVGHPDIEAEWPKGSPCIIDLKGGAPAKWHGLQLAAYGMAWANKRADHWRLPERYGCYLQKTGTPATLKKYDEREDYEAARAAVVLAHWKRRNA